MYSSQTARNLKGYIINYLSGYLRLCGWLITTAKDNKTMEIDFLKNESKTMISFVLVSQSANSFILGRYLTFTEKGTQMNTFVFPIGYLVKSFPFINF